VILRALLTVGVLAYLATNIDFGEAAASLLRLDLRAALTTLALVALDRLVVVWRWLILLRAVGARIATKSAIWIYLVSSFLGGFLLAGIGADAARAFSLTQRTAHGSQAVASVAVDRALGLMSMLIVAFLGILIWAPRLNDDMRWVLTVAAALSLLIAVAFLWADRGIRAALPARWHTGRFGSRMLRLADALAAYRGHRGAVGFVLLLSIGVQLLRILQAYVLGRGIGLDVEFTYYLVFMPIGLIALLLPVSISGFGIPQGIIVWLLQPVGVPTHDALALSTLIVLTGIVANVPGAWLYLTSRRAAAAGS
jgi:glycosyltransferase 2 family protein